MGDKKVLLTGMVRTGSTVVWQVLNDMNKYQINRAYTYIVNQGYTTFVTYRDFRDVLVSWAKLHNSTIPKIYNPNNGVCNVLKYKKKRTSDW